MTPALRAGCRVAVVVVCWLTFAASTARAQDSLARAKDFYASAAYEEALQVLVGLRSTTTTPTETSEVAAYQVFCLVALGRSDEAKHTVETLVRADPQYHPEDASPRLRAFFEDIRRPLLPEIVRESYAKAKDAFERKEMPKAAAEFDRVIVLLDEIGTSKDQGVADLRTLATGFRDLSKVSATQAGRPTVPDFPDPIAPVDAAASARSSTAPDALATTPAKPLATAAEAARIFGSADKDVSVPVAISQIMPPWHPADTIEGRISFSGLLELLIDENGGVVSAVLTKSVHARYDPILLQAAQKWTFRPAMKGGQPVRYRVALAIHLQPIAR